MALALALIALPILVAVWLASGVRVVHEDHKAVVERFGRYRKTLGPGLHLTLRFIHRVRLVDVRETVTDVVTQVLTRDDVAVELDLAVFHACIDPRRSLYDVDDVPVGIARLAEIHCRGLVRTMLLQDLIDGDGLPTELARCVGEVADTWGVRVTRVETTGMGLPDGVQEAMREKAVAERYRAALVAEEEAAVMAAAIKAEGSHQGRLRQAEVNQVITSMRVERESRAMRVLADADRYRQQAIARAQADAIRIVGSAIQAGWAAPERVGVKYLEVQSPTATGQALKVTLPAESASLLGPLAGVVELIQESPLGGAAAVDRAACDAEPEVAQERVD